MHARKRNNEHGGGGGGHDGGGMMRWLLTYADMITLLMAFFIMMYSMSILNLEKFKSVAISIRSGFGGNMEGGKHLLTHPQGQRSIQSKSPLQESQDVEQITQQLEQYINEHHLQNAMQVRVEERGLIVSIITDNMLFPIGSAELRPPAHAIMARIAQLIKGISNNVQVEGHTCDLPIHTSLFPSNWELSSARASRVVRCLTEEYRIPRNRLSAVGYADTHPVASNDSEANRGRNRRVDIVVLSSAKDSVLDSNVQGRNKP